MNIFGYFRKLIRTSVRRCCVCLSGFLLTVGYAMSVGVVSAQTELDSTFSSGLAEIAELSQQNELDSLSFWKKLGALFKRTQEVTIDSTAVAGILESNGLQIDSLKAEILRRISENGSSDCISYHDAELNYYVRQYQTDQSYRLESEWGASLRLEETNVRTDFGIKSGKVILGAHPFWMGNAYESTDFNSLDGVLYYGYQIHSESGEDASSVVQIPAHSWRATPLQQDASACQTPVYLILSLDDLSGAQSFFSAKNKEARETTLDNVGQLLKGTSGTVALDFQSIPEEYWGTFKSFVTDLCVLSGSSSRPGQVLMYVPICGEGLPYTMKDAQWKELDQYVQWVIVEASQIWVDGNVFGDATGYVEIAQTNEAVDHYPPYLQAKMLLEIGHFAVLESSISPGRYNPALQYRNIIDDSLKIRIQERVINTLNFVDKKGLPGVSVWGLGYENSSDDLSRLYRQWRNNELLQVNPSSAGIDLLTMLATNSNSVGQHQISPADSSLQAGNDLNQQDSVLTKWRQLQGEAELVDLPTQTFPFKLPSLSTSAKGTRYIVDLVYIGFFVLACFAFLSICFAIFFEAGRDVIFSSSMIAFIAVFTLAIAAMLLLNHYEIVSGRIALLLIGLILGLSAGLGGAFLKVQKQAEERP